LNPRSGGAVELLELGFTPFFDLKLPNNDIQLTNLNLAQSPSTNTGGGARPRLRVFHIR
jgi:hypothetical protein